MCVRVFVYVCMRVHTYMCACMRVCMFLLNRPSIEVNLAGLEPPSLYCKAFYAYTVDGWSSGWDFPVPTEHQ